MAMIFVFFCGCVGIKLACITSFSPPVRRTQKSKVKKKRGVRCMIRWCVLSVRHGDARRASSGRLIITAVCLKLRGCRSVRVNLENLDQSVTSPAPETSPQGRFLRTFLGPPLPPSSPAHVSHESSVLSLEKEPLSRFTLTPENSSCFRLCVSRTLFVARHSLVHTYRTVSV